MEQNGDNLEGSSPPEKSTPKKPTSPDSGGVPSARDSGKAIHGQGDHASEGACPPGMESLHHVNFIHVKEDITSPCRKLLNYELFDIHGKALYRGIETVPCCCIRCCCKGRRCFQAQILDMHGEVVLHLKRPCTCGCCWIGGKCCCNVINVTTKDGTYLGRVAQNCACCRPKISIYDANKKKLFTAKGPCGCCFCYTIDFKVLNDKKEQIGMIRKEWGGVLKEFFTEADTFGITFPVELSALEKTLLLAAVFYVNVAFFEGRKGEGGASAADA